MSPRKRKQGHKEPKGARVTLRVRRQDAAGGLPYWESFSAALAPRMTVAEALDAVALEPMTRRGERVAAVAYTWGCMGPGCGSCMVLAAGQPVAACATLVSDVAPKRGVLKLEPLDKLGIVRDLLVRGTRMAEATARLRAWLVPEGDAKLAKRPSPASIHAVAGRGVSAFALARCTGCGACVQACPEAKGEHGFVGAAAFAASALVDFNAAGANNRDERHAALSTPGGIHECGQSQNCLEGCPEGLPLDDVLAAAAHDASASFWRGLFRR